MSTIEEMKSEKVKLEISITITDLLKALEEERGVGVYSVNLLRTQNMGEAEPRIRSVTLEVKI